MASRKYSIISLRDYKKALYPYVYMEDNGVCRELTAGEKAFLATPFLAGDGARPVSVSISLSSLVLRYG